MLPDLIEIVPLAAPVHGEITVPGSKSITNRALVLAALADGEVTLTGALWSEDTQVMVDCLQRLGFDVRVELDANEFCNRTITVRGCGGEIPKAGTAEQPLELFVGNAGTAARFLSAMVCLGRGVYRLSGVPRMHERPQAALFSALRELGYQVDSENDKLPAVIHGNGPKPGGQCHVSIEQSSQFASALILSGKRNQWSVTLIGQNTEHLPYVDLTGELIRVFPQSGIFQIDADASSASYFWGADWLLSQANERSEIRIHPEPKYGEAWQIDANFAQFVRRFPIRQSRMLNLGDSIMTSIVLAPFTQFAPWVRQKTTFTDLGRLRVQECERVVALRTELTKCGAKVIETGDTLEVFPSQLHGAEIETYDDHRMAMCFAVLGLKVPGIKLRHPSCVKKTFPNFFQKLAAAPPHGLGVTILDGHTGRKLTHDELFAA
jgi:3-phosphoshikimate 1-carboxyvinyltransferase